MKFTTFGRLLLCIAPLFLLAGGRSDSAPVKPAPTVPRVPPLSATQPFGDLLRTLPRQEKPLLPSRRTPGDVIPPCYMVYGYGTDRHGKGPFLGISGNALPIGQTPQIALVWHFHDQAETKKAAKPAR